MGKSKLNFALGFVSLLAGVLLGALLMMRISGLSKAQGEIVGSSTNEDGTNVTLLQVQIGEEFFTLSAPDVPEDGVVYYDKSDPPIFVDRNKLIREEFMFSLPMMILGVTLMASNRKAFSELTGENDEEDEDGEEDENGSKDEIKDEE